MANAESTETQQPLTSSRLWPKALAVGILLLFVSGHVLVSIYRPSYVHRLMASKPMGQVLEIGKGLLKSRRPCYMTGYLNVGRFGNHIFAYATMRGLSEYCGCTSVILPTDKAGRVLKKIFNLRPGIFTNDSAIISLKFTSWQYMACCIFNPTLMNRCDNGTRNDTYIGGYFQSFKYFDHIRDTIRKELQFRDDILSEAKGLVLGAIKSTGISGPVVVGIHARRGDVSVIGGKQYNKGHVTPNATYYHNAMGFFSKKYTRVVFLVVSDHSDWVKLNIAANRTDTVVFDGNTAAMDMCILSLCNHTIMSIGSYGWWGGYLAGGTTIYFAGHPRPRTFINKVFRKEDYYPPTWIGMM